MADTIAVAKGIGPNRIVIPFMAFPSFEEGVKFLAGKLGEPDSKEDGKAQWNTRTEERTFNIGDREVTRKEVSREAKELFEYYYGGCGDAYAIRLEVVEYATAFAGWDLD